MPLFALIHLMTLAGFSQMHANVLFWAFVMQGDTKTASLVQEFAEMNKPDATILEFKRSA